MVVLKILFLTIKLKKGRFRRLTGDILGGSLCFYAIFTKIHIAVCLFQLIRIITLS